FAAGLAAELVAGDPIDAVAVDAIELESDALAARRRRDLQLAPVPAHAVLRECAAECLRAVIRAAAPVERQLDSPVVRQVDAAPDAVIERGVRGPVAVAGL